LSGSARPSAALDSWSRNTTPEKEEDSDFDRPQSNAQGLQARCKKVSKKR
jgi:hypothetical protein